MLLAEQAGDAHRPGRAAALVAFRADPAEFDHVPIARRAAKVLHRGQHRGRRVRADRAVPRAPVVERIGQHANRAHAVLFGAHAQRQNAERLAGRVDDQHAELLVVAKVPPVGFEPIERVKERGSGVPGTASSTASDIATSSSMSLISTTSTME